MLIQHFLRQLSRQLGKQVVATSPEALERLRNYAWPGNVRELQTILRKSVLRATGPVLVPEFLPGAVVAAERISEADAVEPRQLPPSDLAAFLDEQYTVGSTDLYAETSEMMERYLLTRMLHETKGNQSKAAELLGISRGSLRNKLRALGISIEHVVHSHD